MNNLEFEPDNPAALEDWLTVGQTDLTDEMDPDLRRRVLAEGEAVRRTTGMRRGIQAFAALLVVWLLFPTASQLVQKSARYSPIVAANHWLDQSWQNVARRVARPVLAPLLGPDAWSAVDRQLWHRAHLQEKLRGAERILTPARVPRRQSR